MEELSEIVHRWRKHHLIVRTGRPIKDWYPDELTDDLGINSDDVSINSDDVSINSDDVSINSGLQYHPTLVILSHIKVGIEEPD
jgi:hypothetical protein